MNRFIAFLVMILAALSSYAQKKPLDHSVYDSWQSIKSATVPYNGRFAIYSISPQDGDPVLVVYNMQSSSTIEIPRGKDAVISEDGLRLLYNIAPSHSETRDAKIKKKKGAEIPKDTLAVMDLRNRTVKKYPYAKSVKYGQDLIDHVAFMEQEKPTPKREKKDTVAGEREKPIENEIGNELFILNINTYDIDTIKSVDSFTMSDDALRMAYITKPSKKDSTSMKEMHLYNPDTAEDVMILSADKKALMELPVFQKDGSKLAFYAQTDTAKGQERFRDIYLYDSKSGGSATIAVSNEIAGMPQGNMVWDKANLEFAENGQYMIFGIKEIPEEEDTTIAEFERVKLDIWRWDADYLPTIEKINQKRFERMAYTSLLYFTDASKIVPIADKDYPSVDIPEHFSGKKLIAITEKPYLIQQQWETMPHADMYLLDITTGKRELIRKDACISSRYFEASPTGKYYVWYDASDRNWYLRETETGVECNLTKDIPALFWNDEDDTPGPKEPFGNLIWYNDGSAFILSSKYDIWQFDPTGVTAPFMLTEGIGEKNTTHFSLNRRLLYYEKGHSRAGISQDLTIAPKTPLFFTSFDKTTKQTGIWYKDFAKKKPVMTKLAEGPYTYQLIGVATSYEYPGTAKGATVRPRRKLPVPIIAFTKGNFQNPYDVYVSKDFLRTETQVSHINPQQKDYNWGTVELVRWKTADGIDAEGLLYKPEDFDPAKKYPVIIYFYEKDADELYRYIAPAPSRSIVNVPYFVSNGYIVFDPNIYYTDGHPGQCAMRSIMPGVDMLCENPWIDAEHMAIQGQSWGGYQVAYMITQTDRFAAAGAGAPVSNMTSAYGGIRWGSGITRQIQYENGQSRIGKNLWDGFDLYVENSPLFFVPKVKTPVLIMHNDKDGAVPWYQGIEFFTGLRRCGKQAWLLQYNDEDHNLVQRHNAKDLSVKLATFFDYFLKGAPEPEWMK